MEIITTKAEIQANVKQLKTAGKTIGFVPTMGFLHDGHLELVKQSVQENDITVMSIFVNPLQFGPNEDFESYPRDQKRDEQLAKEAGVDLLFMPQSEEMYSEELSFRLSVNDRVDVLCGKSRPGHFDGVATVLMKLFNLTLPDRAYFGLKDAQQVAVVQALIEEFDLPVKLVGVETVRESDGLARSSRNVYLSESERRQAPELYKSLKKAEKAIKDGERNPEVIKRLIREQIHNGTDGMIDYVELLSYPQLQNKTTLDGKVIIAIAVAFSKARLIDNVIVEIGS
ncbi:pantoate--beta-alanine ligase [Bacillus sp. FJAT-50079]|uniref:pantoate--beta-alanine ligase n=1 Tax=Bacillus sp. FJAT-50079 TaxID=2833577 RepID=UPI001BCA51F5|nr:pantoate--beta-alanine ligase [Bacillus sp. FJAT-50079]